MRVPVLNGPQVQAAKTPTPYSRVNYDTGTDALAQGVQQLGAGIAQASAAHEKAKREANAFRMDEADLQFGKGANVILHDDRTGFMNQQGENALNDAPTYKALEELKESLKKDFKDEAEAAEFDRRARRRIEQIRPTVETHVSRERLKVYEGTATGQMGLAVETASRNYTDRNVVADAAGNGITPLTRLLMARGAPVETVTREVATFRAKVYGAALDQHIEFSDAATARKFFEDVRPALGPTADDYQRKLATKERVAMVELLAEQFAASSVDLKNGKPDSEMALEHLDASPMDAETKKAVRVRLRERMALKAHDWDEKVGDYFNKADTAYVKSHKYPGGRTLAAVDAATRTWLEDNAPLEWQKLERLHQGAMDDARIRRERGRGPGETDAQRDALIDLKSAMVADPEKFKGMTAAELRRQHAATLSESGYRSAGDALVSLQKDVKERPAQFAAFSRYVNGEVFGNPMLLKNKAAAGLFRAYMGDQFRLWPASKGDPNPEDLEEMRALAWNHVVVAGKWWGTNDLGPAFMQPRPTTGPAPAATPAKFEVIGPNGARGMATEKWLAEHPDWKRR